MPRVSMNQVTTWHWSFAQDVDALAAAGCTAIGVAIRKLEAIGVASAQRLLRDAGLAVSCLTSSGCFPLVDRDGVERAIDRTRRHLHAAVALDCDCVMVLPGTAPSWSWEEAAAATRPVLERLLPDAERLGVRLAIEPVSQLRVDLGFLHGFDEALDFVEEFRTPWLQVVLEVNTAWSERRLYDNIARRTARIGLVQVNDFKVGTMAASDRVVMGDGDIPVRRILRALDAAGYAGWYDIELLGPAIEAEGYESVVPRALRRFAELWS